MNNNSNELIYGLMDRPPIKDTLFAALQHLLAIFVAIITPPLIISGALGFDVETTSFLVSMSLFVSGIATFINVGDLGALDAVCSVFKVQVFHLSALLSWPAQSADYLRFLVRP